MDPARWGRLKPCFRDRDELTAAPDLTASVREAIGASDYLVVICTPNGAGSRWVGREIDFFGSLHGRQSVLAALFEGNSATAFHSSLVSTAADGSVANPLAADFRRGGDGKRLALLKLVAVLAGVRLDALIQRDAQRRFRRTLALGIAAAAVLVAMAVLATLALVARAEAQKSQARGVATVAQLVDQREQFKKAGRLDLLQAHDRAALHFFRDQDVGTLPVPAQLLSARLLQGISEDEEVADDLEGMREAAQSALHVTGPLLAASPGDTDRIFAHAQSEYWAGFSAWRRGDLDAAEPHFRAYAQLAERLVTIAPRRADWQREAGDADSNLATFILRRSTDLERAGRLYESAQAHFLSAAAIGPYDRDVQGDLADGYGWLADIARLKGDYAGALAAREKQRANLLAARARDPDDAEIETALIKNQLGLARIAALQGRWADAIAGFEQGRAAAQARSREDRANADIARQVRAFELFEVRTWLDMPARLRPPLGQIADRLDGCAAERGKQDRDEGKIFCFILEARLAVERGESASHADARDRLISSISNLPSGLSERWRLNLSEEAKYLLSDGNF